MGCPPCRSLDVMWLEAGSGGSGARFRSVARGVMGGGTSGGVDSLGGRVVLMEETFVGRGAGEGERGGAGKLPTAAVM